MKQKFGEREAEKEFAKAVKTAREKKWLSSKRSFDCLKEPSSSSSSSSPSSSSFEEAPSPKKQRLPRVCSFFDDLEGGGRILRGRKVKEGDLVATRTNEKNSKTAVWVARAFRVSPPCSAPTRACACRPFPYLAKLNEGGSPEEEQRLELLEVLRG